MPPSYHMFAFRCPPAAMVPSPSPSPSPLLHRSCSFSALFFCFCFCFLFILLLSDHSAIADLQEDAGALLAFKANLIINANTLSSWQNTSDPCVSWVGVTCGADDQNTTRILTVRLPGRSLYGSIPAGTLGKLDALRVLSLRHNHLQSIPSDLTNCVSLRELYLFNNDFSGPLPANFSAWPLLRRLDLSFNSFNGSIPPLLNNLTQLRFLRLEENDLSGPIPYLSDIAPKLQNFSVAGNNLSGSIPSYLARFGQESFAGNSELCGSPLQTPCANSPLPSPSPSPNQALSPPVSQTPSPPSPQSSKKKLTTGAIAAIVVGSVAGAALLFVLCLLLWVRRGSRKNRMQGSDPYAGGRDKFESRYMSSNANVTTIYKQGAVDLAAISNHTKNAYGDGDGEDKNSNGQRSLNKLTFIGDDGKPNYDLDDLLRASAEVLGKGSLGTAYKATMSDGLTLSVKRLREIGRDMDDEEASSSCKSAMEAVGRLRHPNLVPVRAFFFTKKEKLIISDYMPQGNLFSLLHGNNKGPMEWAARLAIASGAAKGLVFLHSKKVVHGNIKSMNVLLDKEGVARWSDYGLLQKLAPAKAEALRPSGASPNGYTPPEVASGGKMITYKGDVYSFGVLLLELITGKSPMTLFPEEGGVHLPKWVESCARHVEAVDPWIREKFTHENDVLYDEVLGLLRIALPCVSPSPDKRPHMVEIVKHIQDLIETRGNV